MLSYDIELKLGEVIKMKKIATLVFLLFSALSFAQSNVVRKISVTGNSEREISPDMAKISFSVQSKKDNLNQANRDVNDKIEKFKADLGKKKIILANFETVSFFSTKRKEEDPIDTEKLSAGNKKNIIYNINLTFSIRNTEFEKISSLMSFSEEMMQSVKRDYETNSFYFSLEETDADTDKGLSKVFKKFDTIKKELISSGVQEENINLNYHNIKEVTGTTGTKSKDVFIATHKFTVELKDLKKLNELISIADDNSINIEGTIQFDISDKEKIESEMYSEAFNQAKTKAVSILKSSKMALSSPLVVSEDVSFQQKMIDRIDESWEVQAAPTAVGRNRSELSYEASDSLAKASERVVDYTPKPIKLSQNISVMYEIK